VLAPCGACAAVDNVAVTADIHDMAGLQALMASPSPEGAATD
jgi:hypothetical protein